jgi:hypothetical protein
MTRPAAWAFAMMFLAFSSLAVYAAEGFELPRFVPAGEDEFYPDAAARKLLQGAAGVDFMIDAKGRAQVLGQRFADNPEFGAKASEFIERGRFNVPDGWEQAGGTEQRFFLEVQFSITRGGDSCARKPPRLADSAIVTICKVQVSRRSGRL